MGLRARADRAAREQRTAAVIGRAKSVTGLRAGVAIAADAMAARIEELETECARLVKENAELWESVHELQDMNARAREDA